MADNSQDPKRGEQLLDTPHLAGALESEQFKAFLDHVPVAIGYQSCARPNGSYTSTKNSSVSRASRKLT